MITPCADQPELSATLTDLNRRQDRGPDQGRAKLMGSRQAKVKR